jgi:hypothetical protein
MALLLPALALAQAMSPGGGGAAVPEGVCGANMSCEVASLTSSGTVQSDALSGQYAFKPTVNGSKVGVGTGSAYFDAPDANTIRTIATLRAQGGVDVYNGGLTDGFSGSVQVSNVGGIEVTPISAPWTCASTRSASQQRVRPGTFAVITGSTGKPQRLCLCTYDGTNYRWWSSTTNTYGDTTTCPEAA